MKKTIKRIAPAMLILMALATLSFMAKNNVTLRLHPQKGKSYVITSKATTMNMMEVQGQAINSTQSLDITQSFSVKDVSDAQSTFETQIESVKMSVSQMGMKFEYDSEHPEKTSPMIASQTQEIGKSIKKPSTVSYDMLGNVVGDTLDLEMSQLGGAIAKLPEEELTVGSQWTINKSASVSNLDINSKFTYTVTSISKKSVDVSVKGNVENNDDGVTGTYDGTASFDPQTGMITKSSTKSNLSMTLTEQGMSIPVTMVGNTTVTVEEK